MQVANRAIGGDVTRGILFRLKEDVLELHPKAVVLLIGTNDLSAKEDPSIAASNIGAILDQIASESPAPPVVLCTLPPRQSPEAPIDASQVAALNGLIKQLANAKPNVTLFDTYPLFAKDDGSPDPEYFRPDKLHFAAPGYEKLRQALDPVFANLKLE
jgi:lysophospholipase L1-like esterase